VSDAFETYLLEAAIAIRRERERERIGEITRIKMHDPIVLTDR